MTDNNMLCFESKCTESKKDFYIRLDRSVMDVWVMTYGLKQRPVDRSGRSGSSGAVSGFNLNDAIFGPQYSCPWCGNKGIGRCGRCGEIHCIPLELDEDHEVTCPYCGNIAVYRRTEDEFSVDTTGGRGQ